MSIKPEKFSTVVLITLISFAVFNTSCLIKYIKQMTDKAKDVAVHPVEKVLTAKEKILNLVVEATWYADGLPDPEDITCAYRNDEEFPRGTRFLLENTANGKRTWVRKNDFGPEEWTGRDFDLSRGAARKLGYIRAGVAKLKILDVQHPAS